MFMSCFKMKCMHIVVLTLVILVAEGTDRVKRQSSCFPFEYFLQRNVYGASGNSAGTTAELCKQECLSSNSCYAADYNPNANPKCWLHSSSSVLTATKYYNSDTTHFAKDTTCSGGSCSMWTVHTKKNYPGATGNSAGTTAELCKEECLNSATMCYAVDFNDNASPKCWIFTSSSVLDATLHNNVDTTHYRRNLGCTVPSCKNTWEGNTNKHYTGATGDDATDLEACKQNCVNHAPTCYAVDWNPNGSPKKCWIHTNPAVKTASLGYAYGVTHYKRFEECPAVPQVCHSFWEIHQNKHYTGANGRSNVATLDKCFDECAENSPYCYGFDWDFNPGASTKCWIHTNSAVQTSSLYYASGVTHYRRRKVCKDLQCPPSEIRNPENGIVNYFGWNTQKSTNSTCEAVYTDFVLLRNPKARFLKCNGINLGNSVSYSCDDGFTLAGSSVRTCQFDGRWSGSQPVCQ